MLLIQPFHKGKAEFPLPKPLVIGMLASRAVHGQAMRILLAKAAMLKELDFQMLVCKVHVVAALPILAWINLRGE
jgi:hypothetical protein